MKPPINEILSEYHKEPDELIVGKDYLIEQYSYYDGSYRQVNVPIRCRYKGTFVESRPQQELKIFLITQSSSNCINRTNMRTAFNSNSERYYLAPTQSIMNNIARRG
jgi:hypothetical protein